MGDEGTKETFYGYPGDSTPDWYSSHGIGDHDNLLVGNYSAALTESERLARFGVSGKSTGQEFTFRGQTFRDDDTAPESDRRVDVFQPNHPPDIGGRAQESAQEPGLYVPHTEEEYRQMYSEGIDHERPADDEAPLTSFRRQFPEDNEVKDDDILSGMRQRLAPDMDPAQFAVLARSKNGRKAIEAEVDKGLTPYQRLRKQFPEAADKSEDDFLLPIYNKLGSVGKLDSRVTSFSDFKDLMNPQSGPVNAAYQFWKGASREASAVGHSESAKAWTALNPTTFSNLFYDAMDSVGNWVSPGANAGTQVKKWTQVADDWLDKNSYVNDYWRNFVGWMHDKAQDQNKQAQIDATRAQQAKGWEGTTGRVLGAATASTAAGFVTNLIPGAPIKSAVLAASMYEGLSRYGASVQANQDQRLIEAIQGAGMGAVYRYMWDSPNGRLLNGFTLWAADAGEDTLTKWLKGEKVDYQETAVHSALDIVSGVLMKGHQESLAMPERKLLGPLREPSEGQAIEPYEGDVIGVKPITPSRLREGIGDGESIGPKELKERVENVKPEAQFNRPAHEMELTYHSGRDPVMEEVDKAIEARNNGDTEKAGEHLDRALSAMPPKERKKVAQEVVRVAHDAAKTKNGDSPADTPETRPERKEADKASEIINSHFYGLSPKRGESGAAANPFGGRQYRPGRHNKFAQEEEGWRPEGSPLTGLKPGRDIRGYPLTYGQRDLISEVQKYRDNDQITNQEYERIVGEIHRTRVDQLPEIRKSIQFSNPQYEMHENEGNYTITKNGEFLYGTSSKQTAEKYFESLKKNQSKELPPEVANDPLFLRLSPDERARYLKHLDSVKRSYPGNHGEAGYTINFAAEIYDWFQEHWPKKVAWPHYGSTFRPQGESPEAQSMWVASKKATSEAQQATASIPREIARELEIDNVLRGGEKGHRRSAAFDKFNDAQMKEMLASAEEGDVHTGNPVADWLMNKFYKTVYKALYLAEKVADFDYKEIPDYLFHAIKHNTKDQEDKLQAFWDKYRTSNPRWTKHRQFPTLRQLFEAGFELQTLNPERLMQMRLASSMQAIRKVMTLRDAVKLGGAVSKEGLDKEARKAFEGPEWTDIRAPNGEDYFVTKKAAKVVANAWEPSKLYTGYVTSPIWRTFAAVKGVSAQFELGWSIAHGMHIALTYPASALVRAERSLLTGQKRVDAFNQAMVEMAKNPVTGYRLLDAWRGKKVDLTPNERQNLDDLKQMGLDLSMSEERMMGFAQRLQEMFPQWRNTASRYGGKLLEAGHWIGTAEPLMRFQFGTFVPLLKIAGAIQAREALYRAKPELLKPENEKARRTEIAKIGDQIDMRFGEINYSNVYWPRIWKDVGQMSLLSLGWQMNVFNFMGGFVHDMTSNAKHMGELAKKVTGRPSEHTFLTDRILFTMNYAAIVMAANALRQIFFTGQQPEGRDYVFPRIGKDNKGEWIRARPIEFTTEFGVPGVSGGILQHHIEQAGGGAIGGIVGTSTMAMNKMNPFISNVIHWFGNKNYFGQEIRSELDPDLKQLQDSLNFLFVDPLTPIPFKQNTGQPFDWTVAVKSMMGLPRASGWASRSPTENLIEDTFHREHPYGQTKEQEEYGQAHQALAAAIRDKDDQARIDAVKNLRKLGVSDQSIKMTTEHAHSLPADISKVHFKRLNPIAQQKILKRMTPEEMKVYLPLASKAARAQLQPPAQ